MDCPLSAAIIRTMNRGFESEGKKDSIHNKSIIPLRERAKMTKLRIHKEEVDAVNKASSCTTGKEYGTLVTGVIHV